MTIKKQLTLLSLFIILIPVLCTALLRFQSYIQTSKNYLMKGTSSLDKYNSPNLSQKDLDSLYGTLKVLPPEVQFILISTENNEILLSNIKDFPYTEDILITDFFSYMEKTSVDYFYQISSHVTDNGECLLFTRMSKAHHAPNKRANLLKSVMLFLTIFISICFIMVIFISKTIFSSINKINIKTRQLAEGNLSEKLVDENDNIKRNEITSIMESLEKMRCSLIEVMNKKNKFIMGISHDLRTPVAIIKGYSEAITDGVISSNDEILQSVQLIEDRTTQLGDMIDSLINYVKLNDSEIRQQLTPGPISSIIKDFTKSSILTANVFKRNIISNINIPDNIFVPLNEQLVLRSFENLFSNALRYTKDGDTIEINSYQEDSTIILEIKDTGIGIEEKDLDNIFDLFYRGTNSRREEGMGIGLSVVKNIIDTHGWNISVKSEKDKGTCFKISIPF